MNNVSSTQIPGPRTSPTVKPLNMMQRSGRDAGFRGFEVRLGVSQIVVLLGLTTGSMLAAFYVGLHSGQTVGFESALARMASVTPRLPVPGQLMGSSHGEEESFDAYAKLNPEAVGRDAGVPAEKAKSSGIVGFESVDLTKVKADLENAEVSAKGAKDVFTASAAATKENVKHEEMPELASIKKLEREVSIGDIRGSDVVGSEMRGSELKGSELKGSELKGSDAKLPIAKDPLPELVRRGDRVIETKPGSGTHGENMHRFVGNTQIPAEAAAVQRAKVEAVKTGARNDLQPEKPVTMKAEPAKVTAVKAVTAASTITSGSKAVAAPAQAKEAATTNSGNLVREILPKGWFAQIAAPKKLPEANGLAQKLRKSGFPVMIEVAQVRGEEYFRVVVGPESSKNEGQILLQQLGRESYLSSKPFLRVVK